MSLFECLDPPPLDLRMSMNYCCCPGLSIKEGWTRFFTTSVVSLSCFKFWQNKTILNSFNKASSNFTSFFFSLQIKKFFSLTLFTLLLYTVLTSVLIYGYIAQWTTRVSHRTDRSSLYLRPRKCNTIHQFTYSLYSTNIQAKKWTLIHLPHVCLSGAFQAQISFDAYSMSNTIAKKCNLLIEKSYLINYNVLYYIVDN